jgi:tetratricopeptide (TPR) repeat protein
VNIVLTNKLTLFTVQNIILLLQDYAGAVDLATKALDLKPNCFEAYYARARAKRDDHQYSAAQADLMEALRLAPNNREVRRLLTRIKEECTQQVSRYESGVNVGGGGGGVGGVGGESVGYPSLQSQLEMDRISEDEDDPSSLALDLPSRSKEGQRPEETEL